MTNVNHILKSNSDKLCILFSCQRSRRKASGKSSSFSPVSHKSPSFPLSNRI